MRRTLSVLVCLMDKQAESAEVYAHAARFAESRGGAWGALRIVAGPVAAGDADASMALAHRLGGATLRCGATDGTPASMAQAAVDFVDGFALTRLVVADHSPAAQAFYDALIHRCGHRWPRLQVEWLPARAPPPQRAPGRYRTALGVAAVLAACVAVNELLRGWLYPDDALMVYLAGVAYAAAQHGRRAALVCAAGGVLLFDLLTVPPRWSLAPIEPRYYTTIAMMAAVGWLIGTLAGRSREQGLVAQSRALHLQAINDVASVLAAARTPQAIGEALCGAVRARLGIASALMLPPAEADGAWEPAAGQAGLADVRGLQSAREQARETGRGTVAHRELPLRYVPLQVEGPVLAVLAVEPMSPTQDASEDWRLLRAMAAQAATALERLRLEAVGAGATLASESERLRNTLLAGISHDLRAPLTTIIGAASTLHTQHDAIDAGAREKLLLDLLAEALHMHRTLTNVLELTRLENGAPCVAAQWCPADELVLGAVEARATRLAGHHVETAVPPALVVWCDPLLMDQLLGNLLDNAAVHTPVGTTVRVAMARLDDVVHLIVHDDGPGLPAGREAALFGKFVRGWGDAAGGSPGLGLGLAICTAVARLHGGSLTARNDRGARFVLTLPQPSQRPTMEAE